MQRSKSSRLALRQCQWLQKKKNPRTISTTTCCTSTRRMILQNSASTRRRRMTTSLPSSSLALASSSSSSSSGHGQWQHQYRRSIASSPSSFSKEEESLVFAANRISTRSLSSSPSAPSLSSVEDGIEEWNAQTQKFLDETRSQDGFESLLRQVQSRTSDSSTSSSSSSSFPTIESLMDDLLWHHHQQQQQQTAMTRQQKGSRRNSSTTTTTTVLNATLAWELLDRALQLERALREVEDDASILRMMMDTDPTTTSQYLDVVLQLWKTQYIAYYQQQQQNTHKHDDIPLMTPSQVLSKLDDLRASTSSTTTSAMNTTTTHLISPPDVRSYNIVLEAASKDLSFCNRLWDWMWEESSSSSLSSYDASSVRPDLVTLRTFMKAWVKSGHPDAPEHCEDLVEEWMIQQQQQNQQNTSNDASMIAATRGIRKSLIHVWALQDPVQAEAYLKDMIVQRQQQQGGDGVNTTTYYYYDNDIEELPDTIAWNRVISAYAISHGRPDDAARLLEEFWRFSKSLDENEYGTEYGGSERQSQNNHHGIRPDLFSYNSVLEGWARVGNAEMANQTMRRLQRATLISPNIVSYTSAMKANMAVNDLKAIEELAKECLQAADDEEAKAVEEEEDDSFSSFQSYDMARDNDEFSDSSAMIMSQQRQQQQQQQRHLVLDTAFFNTWLSAYSQTTEGNSSSAGMVDRALNILKEMKRRNVAPDTATYLSLFRCFLAADEPRRAQEWLLSEEAKHMEEASIVSFVSRLVTWNSSHGIDSMALLQGLYEQDYLTDIKSWDRLLSQLLANQGKAVLEWLKSPTTKSYSLVLRALAKDPISNNNGKEAESLFRQWQNNRQQQHQQLEEGNNNNKGYNDGDDDDDDVSEDALLADMYTSVIIGWSKSGNLERTLSWYEEWASAKHASTAALPPPNRTVQTAVLSAYARAQDAQGAENFLKRLVKDYNDRRKGGRQQQHHQQQPMDGRPDVVMFNIVLNAWAKCNNAKRAERLLNAMPERNTISYNTVIHAYVRKGKMKRAEELANHLVESFRNGKNNGRPDLATFRSILSGYVRSTDPNAAERASRVIRWMKELHHEGILQSPPDSKCYELQHKAGGGSKSAKTTR